MDFQNYAGVYELKYSSQMKLVLMHILRIKLTQVLNYGLILVLIYNLFVSAMKKPSDQIPYSRVNPPMGAQVERNQFSGSVQICEFDLKKYKKLKMTKFRKWADS